MRRTRIAAVIAGLLGAAVGAPLGSIVDGPEAPPLGPGDRLVVIQSDGSPLHEDEPGWNCELMGNRVCG